MKKAVFCCVLVSIFLINFSAFAEECRSEGGFQRENPYEDQDTQSIFIHIDVDEEAVTIHRYEGSKRMTFCRYRTNRTENHDRLIVFKGGTYRIIRINIRGEVASITTSDGIEQNCIDSEEDICQRARRIYERWSDMVDFEGYIWQVLENRFLP